MIKKAIFGGTFDPIHNGHLHIAYEALYKLNLDKIIFMPSGNPPHKLNKNITEAFLRYEMVKTAIRNEDNFDVSDYEINRDNLSYTYQTLEHFTNLEKETKWYFITGVDCLMDIENWKNTEEILNLCTFVVFNRTGYSIESVLKKKISIEKKCNNKIVFLDIPLLEISSTNIRKHIKEGRKVSHLMPESVCYIIEQLGLYK
ncbi:nicotinate-nucleotide adenylyltransferase [Clostridium carboxidivorans P7]|uniref:Probable nicotinate-nucleotide adenylyltransferase n=1 Tax=Clostridium carboxidivorans P7 TaxID=536227 RepID=C6PYN4_9CLOT|nr:nicotinate-nucleotide adenylyltransferase [Clostridium carboxidivorans]AKN32264.1 nicotinate-nucleotide adenylyltransferase [Clostridium carboxidivorans P7]EET85667.1 nicotinate (nicotinamide) nucleotide adenylyltransferase [Clostridium carboxidivorans P7]